MVLRLLTVENFVLIENISIEFDLGLCILSGETGAGKSIILDRLVFMLGLRNVEHRSQVKETPYISANVSGIFKPFFKADLKHNFTAILNNVSDTQKFSMTMK